MESWEWGGIYFELVHTTHNFPLHHSHTHSPSSSHMFAHRPDNLHTDKDTDSLRSSLDTQHDHAPAHTQYTHTRDSHTQHTLDCTHDMAAVLHTPHIPHTHAHHTLQHSNFDNTAGRDHCTPGSHKNLQADC